MRHHKKQVSSIFIHFFVFKNLFMSAYGLSVKIALSKQESNTRVLKDDKLDKKIDKVRFPFPFVVFFCYSFFLNWFIGWKFASWLVKPKMALCGVIGRIISKSWSESHRWDQRMFAFLEVWKRWIEVSGYLMQKEQSGDFTFPNL